MKRMAPFVVAALAMAGCADSNPSSDLIAPDDALASRASDRGLDARQNRSYEVIITNLTASQPFTPPLIATHRNASRLFQVGEPASFGLKQIAENGNLAPLLEALEGDEHVWNVAVAVAGDPPPLMPGQSVTAALEASEGARFLSFASMLICTNDGFTGLEGRRLPVRIGEEIVFHTAAYDAGSEINTEDFADLVPPCPVLTGVPSTEPGTGVSDPALAENGVIHHHAGIQGSADLSVEAHGWSDPVAMVRVRRID